eukprot:CAMPEP_0118960104 /NCGR_PEP_ID=MMETSP1169-20130426/63471_1 /TAXON_ID=36882 /ORGANISM="Pyramimonas obovata, Strain CCMP722" /LENGTH=39 /DNA_ID= /DNA_START= /DNA_END= /DNA_ORIENTATION=
MQRRMSGFSSRCPPRLVHEMVLMGDADWPNTLNIGAKCF